MGATACSSESGCRRPTCIVGTHFGTRLVTLLARPVQSVGGDHPISDIQILCRVLVFVLVILLVAMLKPIESAFNLDTFPSCVLSGLRVGSQANHGREATALNSSTFFKSVIVAEDGQNCIKKFSGVNACRL